jgi:kynurenine formamidase
MITTEPLVDEDAVAAIFERCRADNWGRWGDDDELGTLNYITSAKRISAAAQVREGRVVSLAQAMSKRETPNNPRPILHHLAYEDHAPHATIDYFGMVPHGFAITHLDAIGHVFVDGLLYNGRRAEDVVKKGSGLEWCSIYAQREGIFSRGVLLDVAGARGQEWLAPGEYITVQDLEAAEKAHGLRVESGDVLFVRVGLEEREKLEGPEDRSLRAGLDAAAVLWLHEREVAVYSGDCIERMPYPSAKFPVPLHMIGLAAMGLVLLDAPVLDELTRTCRELDRFEFLLTMAPITIPNATGSPVNPIAIF